MLEAIITYLNLKLGLLNYFEQQHCLCELKSDNEGKVSPVEYVGDANYTVVSHDAFDGVSYWRLRDKPTQDVLETKYQAGKRVEVKIPLRLVFSVRRDKLTTDDAYAFDRIRQTVVAQFNFDDGILKTTLGCEKVTVSVPTSNGDAKEVWDEETSETGTFEPTYAMVYGSIDIEVSVIYAGSCLPTECDDIDPNILHAFDFCKPSVVAQLTAEQVTCLEGELCVPLCEQLAAILPEDVVADVFDCLTLAAQTELLDSECVIPPCSPVTQQVNGTTIGTTASGGTNNQVIRNTAGTAVGTSANPSVIANTTLRNSATPTWTDSVVSGVTKTLAQGKALDSDGATTLLANYIPTTDGFMFTCTPSPPCADATIEINGTAFDTVASGGTLDIPVINGGSNAVGSLQGSDWVIGNNATFINSVQVTDQEAEIDANIAVELDGNPSGSWNAGTQTWEVTSAPCPPVPSLSVGLSNSTPNFGDAVTITVTPTGITPTSYTFRLPLRDGTRISVTQASNVYVWTTDFIGATTIEVSATDGVSTIIGSIAVTPTSTYLLDTYTTANAAFSVRKLRSAYAGFCLTVRRSSDNTTLNVGFVNDMLDVASILTFVGTGNGFVTTWYDQSTTASNATQTVATNQPLIVSNGFLNKRDGLPAILFGGISYLTYTSFTLSNRTFKTAFCVVRKSTNDTQYNTLIGFASDYVVQIGGANINLRIEGATSNIESTQNTFRLNQLTLLTGTGGTGRIRANGVQMGSGSANDTSVVQRIGVNTSSTGRYLKGEFLELIIFPDDQTANFTAIENDQLNYFI